LKDIKETSFFLMAKEILCFWPETHPHSLL